jgi:hypothetical protein
MRASLQRGAIGRVRHSALAATWVVQAISNEYLGSGRGRGEQSMIA